MVPSRPSARVRVLLYQVLRVLAQSRLALLTLHPVLLPVPRPVRTTQPRAVTSVVERVAAVRPQADAKIRAEERRGSAEPWIRKQYRQASPRR